MTTAKRVTQLLGGQWHGSYGSAYCPAHDNKRTPALSLRNGTNGTLLAKCFAGCASEDVLEAIKALGHLTECAQPLEKPKWRPEPDRTAAARQIWLQATVAKSTATELYLRSRGLLSEVPASIRHHPGLWHSVAKRRLPAMIAAIERRGVFVGVQRTFLSNDGRKAAVSPARMMLGNVRQGAAVLRDGDQVLVAEGIETALAFAELTRLDGMLLATLGTSGMSNLLLPSRPGKLTIAADSDAAGLTAAETLARRARTTGWSCEICPAPDGKDWNDVAMDRATTGCFE